MSRRPARITQDEVARMLRAAKSCGLPVQRVTFDGDKVVLDFETVDEPAKESGLLAEPKL